MRERIDRLRRFAGSPKGNAALTALAVFLGLYLAVGIGLVGPFNPGVGLLWPWYMRSLALAVLLTLGAFAGVSVFVYRLRLRLLLAAGDSAPAQALEGEPGWRTPRVRAALMALAVFLGLYLAVGTGLYGSGVVLFSKVWRALIWPLWLWAFTWAVPLPLAAFAGVSLFVYLELTRFGGRVAA